MNEEQVEQAWQKWRAKDCLNRQFLDFDPFKAAWTIQQKKIDRLVKALRFYQEWGHDNGSMAYKALKDIGGEA